MHIRITFQVHQDKVGPVSFTDKAPFGYLETYCYRMRHFFHHFFQRYFSLFYIGKHQQKRMLYQGKTCMRMQIRTCLTPNRFEQVIHIAEKSFFF